MNAPRRHTTVTMSLGYAQTRLLSLTAHAHLGQKGMALNVKVVFVTCFEWELAISWCEL